MSRRRRSPLPRALIIGAPLVLLAAGGTLGWLNRESAADRAARGSATGTLPESFLQVAPSQPLVHAPNTSVIDPATIIGLDSSTALNVSGSTVLQLPVRGGGSAVAVDPTTYQPIASPTGPGTVVARADADTLDALPPLAPPPSTLAPRDSTTTVAPPAPEPGEDAPFVDGCVVRPAPCSGEPGVVLDAVVAAEQRELAPLVASIPTAAANGLGDVCRDVEGAGVPDPFLPAASRPTVAVLVNQPSTLALTGTWGDGTALDKITMVTLPAHDAEWQRAWEQDKVQRNIVACITLPLDDVRTHAGAGVAELRASVLAISATGRAGVEGQVTLNIPTDGNDPLFADRVTIGNRGEQRLADGVLYPTVHVHYAFVSDAVVPAGTGLDPNTVRVYGHHAFIEGADCTGWAVNQQGRDRTAGGSYTVTMEQRKIAGRDRQITVVDGDVYLDPTLPGGWQGSLCVRLAVTDEPDDAADRAFTLAMRGATLRSPRSALYTVGVALDDDAYPDEWDLQATWATADAAGEPRQVLCPPALAGAGDGDAVVCPVQAGLAPDGVLLNMHAIDPGGGEHPLLSVLVPVNTAGCNLDDPFGYISDGCSTGFVQALDVSFSDVEADPGVDSVRVVVQVTRTTAGGSLWQDPSHAWKVGPTTPYPF